MVFERVPHTTADARQTTAVEHQTSADEQGYSDFGIASLFDCAMPFANRYDLDKPNVDTVILQNNTVSINCLLYTSPSPRDRQKSRMPSSA